MRTEQVAQLIPTAQEALRSFLSTLLGQAAPVTMDAPKPAVLSEVKLQAMSCLTVLAEGAGARSAVLLDDRWMALLSNAMLGEAVSADDAAGEDLVRELAGQVYGTLRNTLAQAGVTLDDAQFRIVLPGTPLSSAVLPEQLIEIPFTMSFEGQTLGGSVAMPAVETAAPAGARRPAPQPAFAGGMHEDASVQVSPLAYPDLGAEQLRGDGGNAGFGLLADVELEVTVELGRRRLPLADLLRLTTGSVVELEKFVGEPLEIYANGRYIAEGEAVVIDERFGIRITNLASSRQRAKAFV